jgi:hypothetical protein
MIERKIRVEDKALGIYSCYLSLPNHQLEFHPLADAPEDDVVIVCPLGCNVDACDQDIILDSKGTLVLGYTSHFAGLIMIGPFLN